MVHEGGRNNHARNDKNKDQVEDHIGIDRAAHAQYVLHQCAGTVLGAYQFIVSKKEIYETQGDRVLHHGEYNVEFIDVEVLEFLKIVPDRGIALTILTFCFQHQLELSQDL